VAQEVDVGPGADGRPEVEEQERDGHVVQHQRRERALDNEPGRPVRQPRVPRRQAALVPVDDLRRAADVAAERVAGTPQRRARSCRAAGGPSSACAPWSHARALMRPPSHACSVPTASLRGRARMRERGAEHAGDRPAARMLNPSPARRAPCRPRTGRRRTRRRARSRGTGRARRPPPAAWPAAS